MDFKNEIWNDIQNFFKDVEEEMNSILDKYIVFELLSKEKLKFKIQYWNWIDTIYILFNDYVLKDKFDNWKKYIVETKNYIRNEGELKNTLLEFNINKNDIKQILSFEIFDKYKELTWYLKMWI